MIINLARKYARGDRTLEEDLIQVGRMTALRAIPHYDGSVKFMSYATTGIIHAMIGALPQDSRNLGRILSLDAPFKRGDNSRTRLDLLAAKGDTFEEVERANLIAKLSEVMEGLPALQRNIIEKIYFEGHPINVAAQALGLTGPTARLEYKKAIDYLRKQLAKN
jgi:RNA polymerase sigma factor (sigma-70 family)